MRVHPSVEGTILQRTEIKDLQLSNDGECSQKGGLKWSFGGKLAEATRTMPVRPRAHARSSLEAHAGLRGYSTILESVTADYRRLGAQRCRKSQQLSVPDQHNEDSAMTHCCDVISLGGFERVEATSDLLTRTTLQGPLNWCKSCRVVVR
jgi:hypothetical protein